MIAGPRAHITLARNQAISNGEKTYQGRACKHHPKVATRWTSNGCCIECSKKHLKPYRDRNADKLLESRKAWDRANPVKSMLQRARRRAKNLGLEFELTPDDVVIPERCPVLGMELVRCLDSKDNAPSLDRIDNDKGYVRGNIIVVSFRANRIKGNATINELRKVVEYYEQN